MKKSVFPKKAAHLKKAGKDIEAGSAAMIKNSREWASDARQRIKDVGKAAKALDEKFKNERQRTQRITQIIGMLQRIESEYPALSKSADPKDKQRAKKMEKDYAMLDAKTTELIDAGNATNRVMSGLAVQIRDRSKISPISN